MRALLPLPLLVVLATGVAAADETRVVARARIHFSDVVSNAPTEMGDVDLGLAPPPGGSRIVTREELIAAVRRNGFYPNTVRLPTLVRVTSASKRISSAELEAMARPEISKQLRAGISLKKIEDAPDLVVTPGASVRKASVAFVPYQKGEARTTAVVELASDDVTVASVPVIAIVEVTETGARPDVRRGARINLVIEGPSMRVTAAGTAAVDAKVGDAVIFHVAETGRTLRARVTSSEEAIVVEGP